MDVTFSLEKESFAIEVGFFDTVLEIKEKIQKYRGIPISKQTLKFNGQILQDDRDVEFCEILEHSCIQLIVPSELDPAKSPSPTTSSNNNNNNKIHLNVKIPSNQSHFPIEIDPNNSIRRLKERIHEIDAVVPVNRIVIQSNGSGAELHDQRSLRDCHLSDNSEIEVCLRASPTDSATASTMTTVTTAARNKLKVVVQSKCGTSKITMEVNPMDNVGELKRELKKVQRRFNFNLPPEGFFFIYDQDVMDEDRSFRWHGVAHGDTIEIFNGSVTGGS